MIDLKEICKLDRMLTEANIPHTFVRCWDGFQIRIYADYELAYELDDCIIHSGSHGYQSGLLETCRLNDCEGWETAEQVFKGWQEMYQDANKRG